MTNPELTAEQIKELQKKYRYLRFVHDKAGSTNYVLEATDSIQRGQKTEWKRIDIPEAKGKSRTVLQFYALQLIDLQTY